MFPLMLAMTAFIGSHYLLSHPLRARLVRVFGVRLFQLIYSLFAIITLSWVVITYHGAPQQPMLWDTYSVIPWIAATVLTYVATALFLASLSNNPAMPGARVAGLSAILPKGVYRITRHPMMMAFALWALAHALVAPGPRSLVLTGGIALLALGGAHMQDRKKVALYDRDWRAWMRQTPFWMRLEKLDKLGLYWGAAALPWLLVTWLHMPLARVPAGIWRWIAAAGW